MPIPARVIEATLNDYVRDELEEGTLEQQVLGNLLMNKGRVEFNKTGLKYDWVVRNKRIGKFRPNDFYQMHTASPEKSEVHVNEDFGSYIQDEYVDDEEELVNGQDEQTMIYDMFGKKTENLVKDGKMELHQEFHTGVKGNRKIDGINVLLPAALGTVHGVAQPANPWFQHVVIDGTAGPGSSADTDRLERVRTACMSADRGDGTHIDVGITTMQIYNKFIDKHQAQERYTVEGNAIGTDLKFINIHNKPIFYDKHAQAGNLRLLALSKWKLMFRTEGVFKMRVKEPSDRAGKAIYNHTYPNLVNKNPRYSAIIHTFG